MASVLPENRLLSALPPDNRNRLLKLSELVRLPTRLQLYGNEAVPSHVYFFTSGVASVIFSSQRGTAVELATTGNEGMIGWHFLLGPRAGPMECLVQVEAEAYRIPLSAVQREFDECEEFRGVMLEFVQHQYLVSCQVAACNRLHRAEERFARWLLMVEDRVHTDTLRLTQEFLSVMLGTKRTTVVEVAGSLERAGAIENRRGTVRILNKGKLEGHACECYPLIRSLLDDLYAKRDR